MTYASVEFDTSFFYGVKDCFLTHECRARVPGLGGSRGVRRADHADAEGGVDGVGQAEAITDSGPIFRGA